MNGENPRPATPVRLYFIPPTNPCGEGATCCAPMGMTGDEVAGLVAALSQQLPGVTIEQVDASQKLNFHRDAAVLRMVNTLGLAVYPVLAVGEEIVSMGPPVVDELVAALTARLPEPAPTRATDACR